MKVGQLALLGGTIMAIGLTSACDEFGSERVVVQNRTDTVRVTTTVTRTDTVIRRDTVRFNEFRTFNQIERLGNPLVAEALLQFKDHGFHDLGTPSTDRNNFRAKIVAFINGTAGRSAATSFAIADVLLPDMLTAQTDKVAGTAGYLGFVFNPNAYGGRKLSDDVVDASLGVVFGPLVDPNNTSPGLSTDNVPAFGGGPVPTATFPYLAAPNAP